MKTRGMLTAPLSPVCGWCQAVSRPWGAEPEGPPRRFTAVQLPLPRLSPRFLAPVLGSSTHGGPRWVQLIRWRGSHPTPCLWHVVGVRVRPGGGRCREHLGLLAALWRGVPAAICSQAGVGRAQDVALGARAGGQDGDANGGE